MKELHVLGGGNMEGTKKLRALEGGVGGINIMRRREQRCRVRQRDAYRRQGPRKGRMKEVKRQEGGTGGGAKVALAAQKEGRLRMTGVGKGGEKGKGSPK